MISGAKHYYYKVLDIPASRICGDGDSFHAIEHVTHPAGYEFAVASNRTSIMAGHRGAPIAFDTPTTWHRLVYNGGTWMTDYPIEQAQCDAALRGIRSGSVLVGGLGLGYAVQVLAPRADVRKVVVVEKSAAVVALVEGAMRERLGPKDSAKVEVVTADLFDYLRSKPVARSAPRGGSRLFNHAFYDIWQSDGEGAFFEMVAPLLALSPGVVKSRPLCWNEDVMRGQLYFGLRSRVEWPYRDVTENGFPTRETVWTDGAKLLPGEAPGAAFHNWRVPFFSWLLAARPDDQIAFEGAAAYARLYGEHGWETKWSIWTKLAARRAARKGAPK